MSAGSVSEAFVGAKWWITRHALARWMQRYAALSTPVDAAELLAEVSREAFDTGTETQRGRAIYMHPSFPTARFIVARERTGRRDALVTILDAEVFEVRDGRRRKRA